MNRPPELMVIAKGYTEEVFVKSVLAPYLRRRKGLLVQPHILGGTGGDVRFERVKADLHTLLRQRRDTSITLLVDYYGIGEDWPGLAASKTLDDEEAKSDCIRAATVDTVKAEFGADQIRRFIPYVSIFELESLYFSEPQILARHLGVDAARVEAIVRGCGGAEKINDSRTGAPSKRLLRLDRGFRKVTKGIRIAAEIGVDRMRAACPLFGEWVTRLERLGGKVGN